MTAPAGVADLSLPDYPTLVARAGVDPRTEAARVSGADPGTVAGTGALLGRAGGEMDAAYARSTAAADTLGQAFTNGGAPVLDRATHVAHLPAGFGDAVFTYGTDGTTVVADDSAGPTNTYRHDQAGRLVAVTDGHGHTLRKRYDAWGNPVKIVERGGGVTRQEFDDRGHLVRRTARRPTQSAP